MGEYLTFMEELSALRRHTVSEVRGSIIYHSMLTTHPKIPEFPFVSNISDLH